MPRAGKKTPASVPETAPWEDLKPRTKAQPRSENADPSVMLEQYAPIVIVFMSGITVVGRFLGVPWLFFLMVWGLLVVAYHEMIKEFILTFRPIKPTSGKEIRVTKQQLVVNPFSPAIIVKVTAPGGWTKTFRANEIINLRHAPDGCLSVTLLLKINDEGDDAQPEWRCYDVTKKSGAIEPAFIDAGLNSVITSVRHKDVPLTGTLVGTFSGDYDWDLNLQLPKEGIALALPEGRVDYELNSGGETIALPPMFLPEPDEIDDEANTNVTPSDFVISQNSGTAFAQIPVKDKTLFLGDVSGSMGTPPRMNLLKRAFHDALDHFGHLSINFAAWDTDIVSWANGQDWIQNRSTTDAARQWVDALAPRGGTNVAKSLDSALRLVQDTSCVVVICDGDVDAFTDMDDWRAFVQRNAKINFSFVCLAESSNHEKMQQMALLGRGGCTMTNVLAQPMADPHDDDE